MKNITFFTNTLSQATKISTYSIFFICTFSVLAIDSIHLSNPISVATHQSHNKCELKLETSLPDVPQKMMVYRVNYPNVDIKWVAEFAKQQFSSTNAVLMRTINYVTDVIIEGELFCLEVDRDTGSYILENKALYNPDSCLHQDGEFPNEEETKIIAEKFLIKHNLMPHNIYYRRIVDNTEGADVMSIGFGRRINGTDFWGAGSEIIMDIGRNGHISRVRIAWPELEPVKQYEIIKPEIAVQKFKNGEDIHYNGRKGAIKNIKLVYYSSPQQQEYIQPCYYISCKDQEQGDDFYSVIMAVLIK